MKTDNGANNRAKKKGAALKFTLFATRPKVGKFKLHPMTGGRMAVLEERGNPLALGAETGDEVDPFVVYEALLVAILDGEELAELSLLDADAWKLKVRKWSMDVEDEVLEGFWDVFNGELDAVKEVQTVPRKKPKKKAARRG